MSTPVAGLVGLADLVGLALVLVVWSLLYPVVDDPSKLPSPSAVVWQVWRVWQVRWADRVVDPAACPARLPEPTEQLPPEVGGRRLPGGSKSGQGEDRQGCGLRWAGDDAGS